MDCEINDAAARTTDSGSSPRALDEVNKVRQTDASRKPANTKRSEPDHLDCSPGIYPQDNVGANKTANAHSNSAGDRGGAQAAQAGNSQSDLGKTKSKPGSSQPQEAPYDPNKELEPPSTPGHTTTYASGRTKTTWDNGAVQVEDANKKTRTLTVPDGHGGYHEERWGPAQGERHKYERPIDKVSGSEEFRKEVGESYKSIPHGIRKVLDHNDFQITTVDRTTDADPDMKGTQPAGYKKGQDGNNLPGETKFTTNSAIIAENPTGGRLNDLDGVVKHEAGHGFDVALNDYAKSDEFRAAYKRDLAKLSPQDKQNLDYYVEPRNENGARETFAEIFCQELGSNNDPTKMADYFPESAALVRKKMEGAK